MSKSILDDAEIAIPCKSCDRKTKKRLGWLKTHREFTCHCGVVNTFNASELVREMAKIDAALVRFKKAFK